MKHLTLLLLQLYQLCICENETQKIKIYHPLWLNICAFSLFYHPLDVNCNFNLQQLVQMVESGALYLLNDRQKGLPDKYDKAVSLEIPSEWLLPSPFQNIQVIFNRIV